MRIKASAHRGFTLVELITVLVIIGIVAGIASNFIVSTVDSYDVTQKRSKLINRGRLVIEQMTRQLRIAMPNSVRVSAGGECVEFLPLAGGGNYVGDVPDIDNGMLLTTAIATAPFSLGLGSANHLSIGALDASEIYSVGVPNSRVDVAGLVGASPYTGVTLATPHRFLRGSVSQRVFVADNPVRFCLIGTVLYEYTGYNFPTGALTTTPPGGGATATMAEAVSTGGQAFFLTNGAEDINTALDISLNFSSGDEVVTLTQQVLIRNVP